MTSILRKEEHTRLIRAVALKLNRGVEPNKCHAGKHRTRRYKQERIQEILVGACNFELGWNLCAKT